MTDNYVCSICTNDNTSEEVTRQKCNHIICWKCLSDHILPRLAPKIKCPVRGCQRYLSDGAIRKVLSDEDTERYERLMLDKVPQMIKCLLPECPYVFIWGSTDGQFDCSECSLFNCLRCRAAHRFMTCEQFLNNEDSQQYCLEEITRATRQLKVRKNKDNRRMFKEMDEEDLFIHDTLLECPCCCRLLSKGDGVILRCSHLCCKYCLRKHINDSRDLPLLCPTAGCKKPLEEREISQLIDEHGLKIYIGKCFSSVRGKLDLTFPCQTADCFFFVEYATKPDVIACPICEAVNCTKCYAIHVNETCQQYQDRIELTPEGIGLRDIERKIESKQLMRCLKCHQVLQKISGCSWIQCNNCRFEMCWARQMRRWGPKGRGDISDGCRCGVNNVRCAPDCGTCIPHNQ